MYSLRLGSVKFDSRYTGFVEPFDLNNANNNYLYEMHHISTVKTHYTYLWTSASVKKVNSVRATVATKEPKLNYELGDLKEEVGQSVFVTGRYSARPVTNSLSCSGCMANLYQSSNHRYIGLFFATGFTGLFGPVHWLDYGLLQVLHSTSQLFHPKKLT